MLIGLWVMTMLLSAGAVGYGLAHARAWRRTLFMAAGGLAIVYGTSAGVLAWGAISLTSHHGVNTSTPLAQATPNTPLAQATPDQTPQPATDAWLRFQSDPGDYIGAGKNQLWTLTESNFMLGGDNRQVRATVSGQGDDWQLWFRAPSNGALRVGVFNRAERAAFVTGKAPGMDIFGSGRGCNTISGSFDVKSVGWTTTGEVTYIDIIFDQHCEGMGSALRGELWISTQPGAHKAPPNLSLPISF